MKNLLVWLLVFFLMPQANAIAQNRTASLKAAYIYYFTKFVYWPSDSPVRQVCLSGTDDELLAELTKVKQKAGAALDVRWINPEDNVARCDLLFWIRGEWEHPQAQLGTLLVVDEGLEHPEAAVTLVMNGPKLSFDINRDNARAKQIEVSAKLLGLAREVYP